MDDEARELVSLGRDDDGGGVEEPEGKRRRVA
jgi:hypothetical protein